jgi:hypothetical protein
MMPVPKYLKNCITPDDGRLDEQPLTGNVICPCGSRSVHLLFCGATHQFQGELIPCTADINGKYFFIIKVLCTQCAREHLLIDRDFHGWNGHVYRDSNQATFPRPPLVAWKCLSCGALSHTARIRIQTQGKQDFIDQTNGQFDPETWPDAFEWFEMGISCVACKKETPLWVGLETM